MYSNESKLKAQLLWDIKQNIVLISEGPSVARGNKKKFEKKIWKKMIF